MIKGHVIFGSHSSQVLRTYLSCIILKHKFMFIRREGDLESCRKKGQEKFVAEVAKILHAGTIVLITNKRVQVMWSKICTKL